MRGYYQDSGKQNGRFGSGTFTQYSGVPESGYEESSSVSTRGNTTIKFDKEILVLSKDYVNYAKINANVKGLTWKSSNTKIATVNKNGEVRAKKGGSHCNPVRSICDAWAAGRAIHVGSGLGYPHSNGCGRITSSFRDYLYEHLKGKYGTRVLYF